MVSDAFVSECHHIAALVSSPSYLFIRTEYVSGMAKLILSLGVAFLEILFPIFIFPLRPRR